VQGTGRSSEAKYVSIDIINLWCTMRLMSESGRNLLSSLVWAQENKARTPIPNLNSLNLKATASGLVPGIYTLVGPNDSRGYLTVHPDGTVRPWDLNYDPEYLQRMFEDDSLVYKGKQSIKSSLPLPPTVESPLSLNRPGVISEGQRCKHGSQYYCNFCYTGTEPSSLLK
jgi:hypothetical protein